MKNSLRVLFWITIANYIAQIPYSVHVYHRWFGANIFASLLLLMTFLLFIIPYGLVAIKGSKSGYVGILVFLAMEFLFYLMNFIFSIVQGYVPFFQLANPDKILFFVFLIGYINFIASGYFLYYFVRNWNNFKLKI